MRRLWLSAGLVLVVFGGLTAASAGASIPIRSASIPISSPCSPGTARRYSHVVVIAFENHSYQSILGSSAPSSYFKTLASKCGTATDFTAAHFPRSLPNYLAATSGSIAGITGDCLPRPGCTSPARSIFTQVGRSEWRAWGQSMPSPCYKGNSSAFVARHVPSLYYTRISSSVCQADTLPLPSVFPGVSRKFVWIAPDLNNDMHNGTPAQASAWLSNFLAGSHGLLRTRNYQAGHMAIFIWFDSGGGSDTVSTPIPLIVIAPSVGHRVVTQHLTDYHLLHGWQGLLGEPCLNWSCSVSGFDKLFHL
jgi:acid phosphatase